ncbi:MAG: hypothetical protein ACI8ZN_001713 [Bacteroidia bacterium]|jgi:hypothetical protein
MDTEKSILNALLEKRWLRGVLLIFGLFILLFALSFPFPVHVIPPFFKALDAIFVPLATFISTHILKTDLAFQPGFISDGFLLYVHVVVLLILAITVGYFLRNMQFKWLKVFALIAATAASYYLAYHLLGYGFNKLFKWQFPMPEPNLVYTELGQLSPDVLFWSAIGSSYGYTVVAGCFEIIAGTLLLFRKTRWIGALLAVAIMSSIVLINVGFGISVKVFSMFLLLCACFVLLPYAIWMYRLVLNNQRFVLDLFFQRTILRSIAKALLLIVMLLDVTWIYVDSGNYNDDAFPRSELHGAYEVAFDSSDWDFEPERMFITRSGFLILEDDKKHRQNISFIVDRSNRLIQLTIDDVAILYEYNVTDSSLVLRSNDQVKLMLKRLPYKSLPIFNFDWRWQVEE